MTRYAEYREDPGRLVVQRRRGADGAERRRIVDQLLERFAVQAAAWAAPVGVGGARHGLSQLDLAGLCQSAQLLLVGELVRCADAVEQPDVAVGEVQRALHHRAQRRDAGAAGDKDEALFLRRRWKDEG